MGLSPFIAEEEMVPLLEKARLRSMASSKVISSKSTSCRTLAQLPLSQDLAVFTVCDAVSGFHSSLSPDVTFPCPLYIPFLFQWPFYAHICLNLCPLLPLEEELPFPMVLVTLSPGSSPWKKWCWPSSPGRRSCPFPVVLVLLSPGPSSPWRRSYGFALLLPPPPPPLVPCPDS